MKGFSKKWDLLKLSEVCKITPSKKEVSDLDSKMDVSFLRMASVSEEGNIISHEVRKLQDVIKGFTYFKEGDVLLAKITPCFENGKRAIAKDMINGIGFGSTEFHVLRPSNKVTSDWIFYSISKDDFRNEAKNKMTGTAGQKRVPKRVVEQYAIPVPDIEEQNIIIDEIETQFTRLDAAVKSLNTIKQKLDIYRKSVLKAAFNWEESKQLKEFCKDYKSDIVDGPFGSDLKRSDYVSEGLPVLKIQNIKPFKIVLKKMDYVSNKKYSELTRHSFKPNDIILTKLGEPLGISAIVPENLIKGIIVADLVKIRTEGFNIKYLCYALNSPIISNHINLKQKGTTRPRVKLSVVRELPIPIATEIQQDQIVNEIDSRFSVIDKIEQTVNASLKKAQQLRKSILKSAFEGKLVKYEGVNNG